MLAARANIIYQIVRLLLAARANIIYQIVRLFRGALNLQGEDGWTALMHASYEGHTEVVKLLLGAGADVSLQNEKGKTALYYARIQGHTEVARLLKEAGATK